ncbi:hypothetical protein [Paenirhodobacter sp.]|uniref:hypothetical protein n=1 Tax=Paenirhodobacter sp. TaxID=1965326 RepID=UPI003B401318
MMQRGAFLVLILALAGCDQSARETGTGGYPSYDAFMKAHEQGRVPTAPPAPVMTEDGSYGAAPVVTPSATPEGSIAVDTLAALQRTAPTAGQ